MCLILALGSCDRAADRQSPLFDLLEPEATGIDFVNELPSDTSFNILSYLYYFNGGGVAAGDVNNDGLPDLYFTSNLGKDRLYLNRGGYRFEDVTDQAGVPGPNGWSSGVTMADVNGDGWLDIYVSSVNYLEMRGRNVLYVNNQDGTFTDRAAELGLDHESFGTQAAFFDYDADGDLDVYLLNSSAHSERVPSSAPQRAPRHPKAGDRLLRNDRSKFVDVSERAGIYGGVEGYGLGVVASDLNFDGCPDVYVANDFQENDFLYLNNCDGTFTESVTAAMQHTSRFSMGVDAGDFNNDGLPDLAVLDMLPERQDILRSSATAETPDLFQRRLRTGYHAQYARNTLQLNRGTAPAFAESAFETSASFTRRPETARAAPTMPVFSDIAYLAGVHATDWSWAPLFADLDNDGWKDLFITNGIWRRPNDLDYIQRLGNAGVQASLTRAIGGDDMGLIESMPHVPLANYAYRNNRDLTFTDVAKAWGIDQPGFSNGAAYVDLNNTGALDLVVNSINAHAAIYRNRSSDAGRHFLRVVLRGDRPNVWGVGAKVIVSQRTHRQLLELMPTRGFQSSVDPRLHFGLGETNIADTITVIWPDRRYQVLTGVVGDRELVLEQSRASGRYPYGDAEAAPLFVDRTGNLGPPVVHSENQSYEWTREPLLPHLLSTEGPALAVGDVNGDSLDDIYVGGAKWQTGRLLLQLADGMFRVAAQAAFRADSLAEDVDAAFFDADGDGDQDLYVVSGGNEFRGEDAALQDRLYVNDGQGVFTRARDALPRVAESGSCVAPADFDGDGDTDLFVGRRVVAGEYGAPPRSYLLENDGRGRFRDATAQRASQLVDAGMVTDAGWLDYDSDGRIDLVVVGEWMPVRLFRQGSAGRFTDRGEAAGFGEGRSNGWWNHVEIADLNADGVQDMVLGNLGLNSFLRATPEQPLQLFRADVDDNGTVEPLLAYGRNGASHLFAGRDDLLLQIPSWRQRFPTYASLGAGLVEAVVPSAARRSAAILRAGELASHVAINDGKGSFELRRLPQAAQLAPIYASAAADYDGDGQVDLLLGGNLFGVTPQRGRYDAGHGLLLRGTGGGQFVPVDMQSSGLAIEGQIRGVALVRGARGGRLVAVARNDDSLLLLQLRSEDNSPRRMTR